ncbi:transglycosylase domain-containing protein [Kitasatospora sp. NPDC052896]|uniref:transglycosylase domain-containing protein n=1 Tax=Kitasatospora sp. NPDC052896 TaxID=3364061 RepID=UPI0037CC2AC2
MTLEPHPQPHPDAPDAPQRSGVPPRHRGPHRRDRRRARRHARRAARRALPLRRRLIPTWRLLLGTTVGLLLLGAAAFMTLYRMVPIPDPKAHALAQGNIYYWSDGRSELARTGAVNRENVPIDRISADTRHAVVAAEDRSFYQNNGIDLKGMLRAAWNTLTGRGLQGGSTITQQYVKNYYLTQDQTLTRKLKEVFIALKVDREESKDTLLAGYLNTSYFGRNAYGVQAAARAYYGVDASALNCAQGAYLAAVLQAPSSYDVRTATPGNRDKAIARWNYVLDAMVDRHWLDPAARAPLTFPEPLDPQPAAGLGGQAGYLVQIADDYLAATGTLDAATLRAGGWRITTTFDKARQDAFADAVHRQLHTVLNPAARPGSDTDVRVAGASVETTSGQIVAVYGGPDYTTQPYDDALRQDNPIGSTFKPIELAAGLKGGHHTQDGRAITTETVYDGDSERDVVGGPTPYAPANEGDVDYGPITLRQAMVKSVNAVYAQEGVDADLADVRRTAIALGIPENVQAMRADDTSMTLGTATPSALDLAAVYAALGNHGQAITPWAVSAIDRVGRRDGLPRLPGHPARAALDRGTADAVTGVLQDVLGPAGTGATAAALGRPAAGKTGTTDQNLSAWFAGYTPQLATAVGLFRENPVTHGKLSLNGTGGLARVNGGAFPTAIWTAYMSAALARTPVAAFDLRPSAGNQRPASSPTPHPAAPPRPSAKQPAVPGKPAHPGTGGPARPPRPAAPASPTRPAPAQP